MDRARRLERQGGSRAKRPRPYMRHVGAQVPEDLAEEFLQTCDRLGVSCASVIRSGVLEYVMAHRSEAGLSDQQELPMTG